MAKSIMGLSKELGEMLGVKEHKPFEQFLQEKCASDYMGTDDDMPDRFDGWLANMDVQEVIDYAEEWGSQLTF